MAERAPALREFVQEVGESALSIIALPLGLGGRGVRLGLEGAAAATNEFAVIGPKIATSNFLRMPNANVLSLSKKAWNLAINDAWIRDIITRRIPVFMSQPEAKAGTIFAREVSQLKAAGYTQVGRWLVPPL